jgi:AGZA family xanthine/uracil permease-like MFS transporter
MIGDLAYTWLAFRLAKRTGRSDITAMPLGLDSPSTIGMAFAVLGPAFVAAKARMPVADAATLAWQVGMAAMVMIGIFKLGMTFVGDRIRRIVPQAGLLGSIGGVGIALLGTLQLGEVFSEPIAGMVAFGIILYALVARIRLPFRAPEVLASVAVGAAIYYALGAAGLLVHPIAVPVANFPVALPTPTLGFLQGLPIVVREYIPLALPFAILTVIGGIDVTESARVAGDEYSTRDVLLVEALATLVAGLFGGVSQTTPYIGHPAYKAMGGRAAYTLATGLVVGLGGIFGYVAFVADVLPKPVLAPILVFIGLEITGQSFLAPPRRHAAAIAIAVMPSVAQLVVIFLSQIQNGALMTAALDPALTARASGILNPAFIRTCGVMIMLANGFILTALLWGSAAAFLIDRRIGRASAVLVVCGALSLFGFIHSVLPSGGVYLPWRLTTVLPYHWTIGYVGLAVLLLAMSKTSAYRESGGLDPSHA